MMKLSIIGFAFGLILPIIAMFIGLQVSPIIATLMLLPIAIPAYFIQQPIGDLSTISQIGLLAYSGVFWMLTFHLFAWLKRKFGRQTTPQ